MFEKGRRDLWKGSEELLPAPCLLSALAGSTEQSLGKVYKECFAHTVDGAPSTAPGSVNFFGSKNRLPGKKQDLGRTTTHRSPLNFFELLAREKNVVNWIREMPQARNKSLSFLT